MCNHVHLCQPNKFPFGNIKCFCIKIVHTKTHSPVVGPLVASLWEPKCLWQLCCVSMCVCFNLRLEHANAKTNNSSSIVQRYTQRQSKMACDPNVSAAARNEIHKYDWTDSETSGDIIGIYRRSEHANRLTCYSGHSVLVKHTQWMTWPGPTFPRCGAKAKK